MSIGRRVHRATVAVTLSVQLLVTGSAALAVCVDGPHTHDGRPAPECPMHHQHATPSAAAGHEHHHSGAQEPASGTTRLTCGCSSDVSPFVTPAVAVPSHGVSIHRPSSVEASPVAYDGAPLERTTEPLSPPPRPSLF